MNTHYYYLVINIGCILIPFLLSFNYTGQFYKKWFAAIPAIIITAAFFIIWDEPFTQWGVWGFNPTYIMGIYFGHLPLEEILFFICIPYACLFTYDQIKVRLPHLESSIGRKIHFIIPFILLFSLLGRTYQKYTFTVVVCTVIFMALTYFIDRYRNSSRLYLNHFYLSYSIILIPFFISNGVLTGTFTPEPIVWYNAEEHVGITAGTIPLNDFVYYLLLFFMNVWTYEWFLQRRLVKRG